MLRVRDADAAKALPFSFLLGAIAPAVVALAPTWQGPDARSATVHQTYLALFQVNPLWVASIQAILTLAFRRMRLSGGGGGAAGPGLAATMTAADIRTAHRWARSSYLVAAGSSSMGHVYTAARAWVSTDKDANLFRMRVPSPPYGPAGGNSQLLARGTFLYLQFDVIIFDVACLVWAFLLLSRGGAAQARLGISKAALALAFLTGWIVIGAGGTVSLALFLREGLLQAKPPAAKAR